MKPESLIIPAVCFVIALAVGWLFTNYRDP